nr:hypothetical protein [Asanoa ferruginea]
MPILKGRAGELTALDHLPETQVGCILPILEVVPKTIDPIKDAYRFAERARDRLPAGPVGIDVRYLADPETGWRRPIRDIVDDLGCFDIRALPVVHPTDPPERLRDHGDAARDNGGRAIVRLGADRGRPDDDLTDDLLVRLDQHVRVAVEQCDLVLDMSSVLSDGQVTAAEPLARKCVSWARRQPWGSITVAAGSMPDAVGDRESPTDDRVAG